MAENSQPGVLCSGNIVLDLVARPVDPAMPWGGTALIESIDQCLGGNGANTAYTLGKLGIPVTLLGMVGNDPFGEFALAQLQAAGVDLRRIRRSAAPTATTMALVQANGDRAFLHRLGSSAEMTLDPDELSSAAAGYAHYHLGTPFGLPRVRAVQPELLRRARAAGLTTSLDTQWDTQGRWMESLAPCLPHVDYLFVNEDETRMLTGIEASAGAAAVFHQAGARIVILKLSRKGCAVSSAEGAFECPAFAVTAVDTTGAGDCFAGAFLAARHRGSDLREAARFANAVAALAIQQPGAVTGVRSWEETVAWLG